MNKKEILKKLDVVDNETNVLKVNLIKDKEESSVSKEKGWSFLYGQELIKFFSNKENKTFVDFYKKIDDVFIGYIGGGSLNESYIYSLQRPPQINQRPMLRITNGITWESKLHFLFIPELNYYFKDRVKWGNRFAKIWEEFPDVISKHKIIKEMLKEKFKFIRSFGSGGARSVNGKPKRAHYYSLVFIKEGPGLVEIRKVMFGGIFKEKFQDKKGDDTTFETLPKFENMDNIEYLEEKTTSYLVPKTIIKGLEKLEKIYYTKDLKIKYNKIYEEEIKERSPEFAEKKHNELLKQVAKALESIEKEKNNEQMN